MADADPYATQRDAALALLNGPSRLSRKAGSFLGQLVVDPTPMTGPQCEWLATLLTKAELPPLAHWPVTPVGQVRNG